MDPMQWNQMIDVSVWDRGRLLQASTKELTALRTVKHYLSPILVVCPGQQVDHPSCA
jgi:hypothetical protein